MLLCFDHFILSLISVSLANKFTINYVDVGNLAKICLYRINRIKSEAAAKTRSGSHRPTGAPVHSSREFQLSETSLFADSAASTSGRAVHEASSASQVDRFPEDYDEKYENYENYDENSKYSQSSSSTYVAEWSRGSQSFTQVCAIWLRL